MDDREFVRVAVLSDEIEAMSLVEFLKEAGIEALVRRYSIPAYDPEFVGTGIPGIGMILAGMWGELFVPADRKEEAEKLIDELRKSRAESYSVEEEVEDSESEDF